MFYMVENKLTLNILVIHYILLIFLYCRKSYLQNILYILVIIIFLNNKHQ